MSWQLSSKEMGLKIKNNAFKSGGAGYCSARKFTDLFKKGE